LGRVRGLGRSTLNIRSISVTVPRPT
jgi:hypothetical protein